MEMKGKDGSRGRGQAGFTLIELSIVLVIVGMLLSVGVGVMNSMSRKSKIAREKANLITIKNALISHALNQGRLPAPSPGGELPFMALSLSLAEKDTWGLPYRYDVTDILTGTTQDNFCVTLYQLDNIYSWYGQPANVSCAASNIACVTDTSDSADDGRIASSTQGYFLAAYISSRGEDHVSGGKNSSTNREYEMRSNPYDVTIGRDDLVEELSFSDLAAKACNARNTALEVTISNGEVWLDNSGGCAPGTGFTSRVNILLGQTLYFQTGCGANDTFEQLARCEVDPALYSGTNSCVAGSGFDGRVSLDAVTAIITQ